MIGKIFTIKVNCFCISEYFFRETDFRHSTADEMLDFVNHSFNQILEPTEILPVLGLIWSRTSFEIAVGNIKVSEIAKRSQGFPHGLVLEHSFVLIDKNSVFQKADPEIASEIEILNLSEALASYQTCKGFEITWHSPNQ